MGTSLRRKGVLGLIAAVVFSVAVVATLLWSQSATFASGSAYVRVNQVGYVTSETKQAILMASGAESGASFSIINTSTGSTIYHAAIGASQGSWSSSFSHTYLLDFSAVKAAGSYAIHVSGPIAAKSPTFNIDTGANLYKHLLSNALFFYQAQHDGPNVNASVMDRQPSHLKDEAAFIYDTPTYDSNDNLVGSLTKIGGPIDVSGGWFDAGDYLKFVQTASYTDAIMLFAARQYPSLFDGGSANFNSEGKYGLDWLQKMWDQTHRILYYQVGIGDGNGASILGDHDFFRLPQADDQLNAKPGDPDYYVEYRPVFRIGPSGSKISPNLAGRLAADFALCYQLYHVSRPAYANKCLLSAETIFDLAKTTNVGQLTTVAPFDFYPETEWRDDLELGATELYFATALGHLPAGLPHTNPSFYLQKAASWAHAYMTGPNADADSLNLYDVSGLADYELYQAMAQAGNPGNLAVKPADVLNDLKAQLDNGIAQAKKDPFGLGIAYGQGDASPHALGYALEASWYDALAGSSSYRTFGLTQRNWILGDNAWGSSFIVGAGSTFPHCMQHQVANLSGSLDGTPPIVLGATVDGPSASANFQGLGFQDGMRACPASGGDSFKAFSGKGARYMDNVIAWPSVEPADDYTALGILVFGGLVCP
ncbi:MAG TPA: glycoside hydrolase family 9 protein [Ktedonobacterales bacterium]|nr:glycoside hydrolase family 9 protein [Ktedonobacterales bacterium]